MKNIFHGYYPPTTEQYECLWNEGLIVVDTNVLLNLYRLPTTARDELISVLELIKDRLWIPHQVALEFQRNRLTVISSERKVTEDALTFACDLLNNIKKKVDTLQIDKRGLGIESQPLLTQLETSNDQLVKAIKAAHEAQLDISSVDPVRDILDLLLENRVGAGPTSQADLEVLTAGGEDRFKDKIPPGFADADKEKNPHEATFIFDNIKYQRKFGDLILWRQLIQHAKNTNTKAVLLVTADRKDDWWWREHNKTIGPHTELVREIQREGGVDLFWMYSSVQFVEHANKYVSASVSTESVAEIEHVTLSNRATSGYTLESSWPPSSFIAPEEHDLSELFLRDHIINISSAESCVERWLECRGGLVEANHRGFPDFVVRSGDNVHGYEVKQIRQFDRMFFSQGVINSLLLGHLETLEGRLSDFTQIIIITERDFFDTFHKQRTSELHQRLVRLLRKYPVNSIIVGAVINGVFEVLAHQSGLVDDENVF
jgi:hypothetical protein